MTDHLYVSTDEGLKQYNFRSENPNPMSDYWYSAFQPTEGEITEFNADSIAAVYACVRLLSFTIGFLPIIPYEKIDEDRQVDSKSPLFKLLKLSPNGRLSAFHFKQLILTDLLLHGNSYHEIIRDGKGKLVAFSPLCVENVTKEIEYANGQSIIYYKVKTEENREKRIAYEKIMHFMYLSKDGFIGVSPIANCRESFEKAKVLQTHSKNFYTQGGFPSGFLKIDAFLNDKKAVERLRSQFTQRMSPSNTGKPAVLERGMTFVPATMSNRDAEFISQVKFGKEEIASIFGVPLHLIQDLENANYNNIQQQSLDFLLWTLQPLLRIIEQTINVNVLYKSWPDKYVEFNTSAILKGDIKSRNESYATARQWGWYSVNDIRRMENQNPIEGGDIYLVPANMQDATKMNSEDSEELPEDNFTRAFSSHIQKILTYQINAQKTIDKCEEGSQKKEHKRRENLSKMKVRANKDLLVLCELYQSATNSCSNTLNLTRTIQEWLDNDFYSTSFAQMSKDELHEKSLSLSKQLIERLKNGE